ncbi:hypothetical protein ABVT39_010141 [Epinephelus coioides]
MVQLEERDKEHQTQEEVTPTAPPPPIPPPPPYLQEPTQSAMGRYPLRGSKATEMEGQLEGRFTVTLTKNNKQRLNSKGLQGPRRKLKLETELLSETESTDGSTSDEGDGELTESETEQPPMIYKHRSRRSSDRTRTTARDLTGSASNEGSRSTEEGTPFAERKERRRQTQMLEWEMKNRQMREEEERHGSTTIGPPPYSDPPIESEPHNENDHSLQGHMSLIDTRGQELLKELEEISRRTEGRLQQMSQLLDTVKEQQLK